jgi:hypothetical protein
MPKNPLIDAILLSKKADVVDSMISINIAVL